MRTFKKAAVIGAGVMGSGIAAHLANAGLEVTLLDLSPKTAAAAIARQLKTGGFMHPDFAARVTPGNTADDLGKLSDADWIVEAVAENPEIKRALYGRIEAVRKDGSIVSSNTSTIPLTVLTGGLPERFASDFLVTHFFNPPRYMRLLEVVASPATRADAVAAIESFADLHLGKSVVAAKDTPGFIANRIGTFWLAAGVIEAMTLGVSVEEADATVSLFGIPPTGIFGLLDLVGVDLLPQVLDSLHETLPGSDPLQAYSFDTPFIRTMIAEGRTGRKSGAGFFRVAVRDGEKVREVLDLSSGRYRDVQKPALASIKEGTSSLRASLVHPDRGGRYAWRVMGATLAYAARLVPKIADTPAAIDEALRLGYGWTRGPFELIDALGAHWFAKRLAEQDEFVPPLLLEAATASAFYRTRSGLETLGSGGAYIGIRRPQGVVSLNDIKLRSKPVAGNASGSLWDLGDGVACLEFHTKMNAFDGGLFEAVEIALAETPKNFRALIIGNDGEVFSAGANLAEVLDAIEREDYEAIDALARRCQNSFKNMKFAPFPIVGALAGKALGAGCEVLLHCSAIQAHAEAYIGLVECAVGLIPAGGGCKEMLLRLSKKGPKGPVAPSLAAFDLIFGSGVSTSAHLAFDAGFLREGDHISINRYRLLGDAKALALSLADAGYQPPQPELLALGGAAGREALRNAIDTHALAGRLKPHDVVVGEALADILSGGGADPTRLLTEEAIFALEREAFLALVRTPETKTRIKNMLATGKPSGK